MRNGVIVSLLVVAILAGAGAGYFIRTSNQSGVTSTLTSHLHQLGFIQESNCPYGSWLVPWAVVINHQTVVQPSNATLPLSYSASRLTGNGTYSTIWFSLPNGTYNYTILPKNIFGQEQTANVTVDGSGLQISVIAFVTPFGCSTTSTGNP